LTYKKKPETFGELVAPFPPRARDLALRVRKLVREEIPEAEENIHGGKQVANAFYSIDGERNVFCGIQPGDESCKVFLHNVADFRPSPLKLEGKGKHAKHVKVRAWDSETQEGLKLLINTAVIRRPSEG
jgi:hypothetical protein